VKEKCAKSEEEKKRVSAKQEKEKEAFQGKNKPYSRKNDNHRHSGYNNGGRGPIVTTENKKKRSPKVPARHQKRPLRTPSNWFFPWGSNSPLTSARGAGSGGGGQKKTTTLCPTIR